jgi:peroxiredoxin (alkyl hydroperoxide reductase subunit C)
VALQHNIEEFHKRNTEILAISVDSIYTHRAWWNHEVKSVSFPIVSDITKTICLNYGTLIDKGISLRGTYIIDAEGLVQHMSINNLGIGRCVDEVLRLVDAIQCFKLHGELCPANWHLGDKGTRPN